MGENPNRRYEEHSDAPMMRIEQLWEHSWPSGADALIGRLRATPAELAEKLHLTFAEGVDDLDSYSHAILKFPSGRVVQVLEYHHYPDYGILMFADRGDDAVQAREEAASYLKVELPEIILD